MAKSADAFRTISEVADWLETPAHVLRFWESKFSQVKPVKRAGGRRYYRPQDMRLLGGIKKLLHDDGMTIKGVQKLLREQGVRHVAALSQPLAGHEDEVFELAATQPAEPAAPVVLDFRRQPARPESQAGLTPEAEPEPEQTRAPEPAATVEPPEMAEPTAAAPAPARLPGFLSRPPAEPEPEPAPAPANIEVPPDPGDGDMAVPGLLSAIAALPRPLPAAATEALRPLIARLRAAHDGPGHD